jgi:hypothetical protein
MVKDEGGHSGIVVWWYGGMVVWWHGGMVAEGAGAQSLLPGGR